MVAVGHKPEGLVADGRTRLLAVGLTNPDRLALVDMDSGRVVRRVALPEAPRHLALAGPGGPVLVPAEKSNELVEVSLPSGRKRVTRVGRQPHDAASDGRGTVFVGNEGGDSVSLVRGGREVRRVKAPVQPGGAVTSTDGRLVAAVGVSERALELYDAGSLRSRGKIDVGVGPTHVAARGRRFFVVDTRGNALLQVLTGGRPARAPADQPARCPVRDHLRPPRKRFWVTLTKTNRVVEMSDRHELRSFATVRQPNSVAVDPVTGRVFVASRADGTLQSFLPARLADGLR
ncbi:MAG: hypothetical protein WKF40_03335 [Thermoleophilaceae bacterium]